MDLIISNFLSNIPTIGLIVVIALSIYVLGKGADFFVDQAIILSMIWKIPTIIIGATIVSLGTTIPEVTVSLFATLNGSTDIALGNAVGSIITNTTLILGLSAYLGAIKVDREMMKSQGLTLVVLSVLLTFFSLPLLSGGSNGVISNKMGIILLVILVAHMLRSIMTSRGKAEDVIESDASARSIVLQIIKLMLGALVVVMASKILIPSVEIVAYRAGIPESIIAATLVAFGTSVPELITAIASIRKGHGELALGNIVGANILNILFVIGLSASFSNGGLIVPDIYLKLQIPLMLVSTLTLYGLSMNGAGEMKKKSGIILLVMYLIYLILNLVIL